MRTQYAFEPASPGFAPAEFEQRFAPDLRSREREEPPKTPAPSPPRSPEPLIIARSWTYTIGSLVSGVAVSCVALGHLFNPDKTPWDWLTGLFFALVALLHFARMVRLGRKGEWRAFLKMDDAGLVLFARRRLTLSWDQIEGCVRLDESKPILRLFLRPDASVAGATKTDAGSYLDLNFARAQTPDSSLKRFMGALPGHLGRVEPLAPIPDVEARPASLPTRLVRFVVALALALLAVQLLFRRPLIEEPPRPTDARPGESVMFLGNSRIYGNDLPKMVRDVADSAHSPIRYDVHMRTWLAATFRQLWRDRGNRDALQKPWGKVILQPESGAFWDEASARDTMTYGEKLIRAARAGGSEVAVIVNWTRGPQFFDGDETQARLASERYGARMAQQTRRLAAQAGADVIDLEGAFAEAQVRVPGLALTISGNDPTHAGSYLAALAIYRYLSGADLAKVRWRPYDVSETQAAQLKAIAARYGARGVDLRGSLDSAAPKNPD